MRFAPTGLEGAWLITTEPSRDERGRFGRIFCAQEFGAQGLTRPFVQQSLSFNHKAGTVRGMHFQWPPSREAKLIRCVRGAIFDAIVDLRPGSPTFLRQFTVELTAQNMASVFVPEGFAHGTQSLQDDSELLYQMTDFYSAELSTGYRYDDPTLGIAWPRPIAAISERDRDAPSFDTGRYVEEYRSRSLIGGSC
jgi:dTDP-4-dehydrorhamnose 3,5-epimerase